MEMKKSLFSNFKVSSTLAARRFSSTRFHFFFAPTTLYGNEAQQVYSESTSRFWRFPLAVLSTSMLIYERQFHSQTLDALDPPAQPLARGYWSWNDHQLKADVKVNNFLGAVFSVNIFSQTPNKGGGRAGNRARRWPARKRKLVTMPFGKHWREVLMRNKRDARWLCRGRLN